MKLHDCSSEEIPLVSICGERSVHLWSTTRRFNITLWINWLKDDSNIDWNGLNWLKWLKSDWNDLEITEMTYKWLQWLETDWSDIDVTGLTNVWLKWPKNDLILTDKT